MARYFNPPAQIRRVGRPLLSGSYQELMSRLQANEVLFAVYENTVLAHGAGVPLGSPFTFLVALYVDSAARLDEIDDTCVVDYYAVSIGDANTGLEEAIQLGTDMS